MKNNDSARTVNSIVYIVLVILSLAAGFLRNHLPQPVQMLILVYFIVTIIFLDRISKDKTVSNMIYARFNAFKPLDSK